MKSCFNKESLMIQQNKFYQLFSELLKKSIDKNNVQTNKTMFNCLTTRNINHSQINMDGNQNINQNHQKIQEINKMKHVKFSKLELENIKIAKENQILRKNYIHLQKNYQNHSITGNLFNLKFDSLTKQSNNEMNESCQFCIALRSQLKDEKQSHNLKEYQIVKLNQQIESLKLQSNYLKDEKKDNLNKIVELKHQNSQLAHEINQITAESEAIKKSANRWKSILSFQKEQILSYQSELKNIKNQYKQLNRKYKIIVKKMSKVGAINSNATAVSPSKTANIIFQTNAIYNELFKEQIEIFSKVRNIFNSKQSESSFDKSVHETLKKQKDPYKSYLTDKETINNPNGMKRANREHYAYFKPNFYNFVEDYFDSNGIDQQTIENFQYNYNYDFLTTIRAIMDSKFNEFLHNDFKNISSFPAFTYTWLSTYSIHKKNKTIAQLKNNLEKDVIPTFFIGVMSEKLNNNWQIITFREFLMESLSVDEMYFYLMARQYVFQGDLIANSNKVFQQISFITVSQALTVLQKFIPDMNYRKKIEDYMKRFIIYIRKRALVDAHFILRILLEYYQSKKHQQFKNIYCLTQLFSKDKNLILSFENFMKVFEYNFTFLSMTQKMALYKKCFSCSRGKISIEVLLTVINQDGYLCQQVKKVFLNQEIRFNQFETHEEDQNFSFEPDYPQLQRFQRFFRKFVNFSFSKEVVKLGNEQLKSRFKGLVQFKTQSIFQRIKQVFNFSINCLSKMFYSKKLNLTKFIVILDEITASLQKISKIIVQKKDIQDIMKIIKRTSAGKRILRFYRKKKNQMQRKFIFNQKIQQDENQDQKKKNIRLEFNHLIQNLKEKTDKVHKLDKIA